MISQKHTHALFFRADVSEVPLEGVDYIRTNPESLMTNFIVMMRPLKAITTLSNAIAAKMQNR